MAAAARTSATPAVAALGTPAKDVLQKTGPATNGQNSKAEEGKPQGKGKGKGGGSEAEKAPKAPRAKNAYMFFTADKRDAVKGEWSCMPDLICLPCNLMRLTKRCMCHV